MSQGLNKVLLIGVLDREPETRFSQSGKPVTTFTIMVSRFGTGSDKESQNHMDSFKVITCGTLAEKCYDQLKKNRKIYLEGRLQSRQWIDDNGTRNSGVEIFADEVIVFDDYKYQLDENLNSSQ